MCYAFFMVSMTHQNDSYVRHKLKRLQDLQTDLYRQLQLLIPDQIAHYDSFLSRVHGSPLLRMDVIERHPYTHFVRLTYQFDKTEPLEIAPDAHIRVYNDARMAEVTSFDPEQGFDRQAHGTEQLHRLPLESPGRLSGGSHTQRHLSSGWLPHLQLFQRCWRQNRALDKWLGYLLHQGHSLTSMQPASDKISGTQAQPVKQTARSA
jgi:uncharacterized protein YqiB (DUF1249 family)